MTHSSVHLQCPQSNLIAAENLLLRCPLVVEVPTWLQSFTQVKLHFTCQTCNRHEALEPDEVAATKLFSLLLGYSVPDEFTWSRNPACTPGIAVCMCMSGALLEDVALGHKGNFARFNGLRHRRVQPPSGLENERSMISVYGDRESR